VKLKYLISPMCRFQSSLFTLLYCDFLCPIKAKMEQNDLHISRASFWRVLQLCVMLYLALFLLLQGMGTCHCLSCLTAIAMVPSRLFLSSNCLQVTTLSKCSRNFV